MTRNGAPEGAIAVSPPSSTESNGSTSSCSANDFRAEADRLRGEAADALADGDTERAALAKLAAVAYERQAEGAALNVHAEANGLDPAPLPDHEAVLQSVVAERIDELRDKPAIGGVRGVPRAPDPHVAEDREVEPSTPTNSRATAQPPALALKPRVLDLFRAEVRGRGLVGEERNAATLYLVITSRLLDRQVSAGVKGHSSSGKSYVVETVAGYFPEDAVAVFTAMSQRALVYSKREFRHKTIVVYEVTALREGNEDDLTSYFVRSLLSEGRIDYEVTIRDPAGGFTTKIITKEGPTNLIFTTTKTRVHAENETRVLSLNTDDSTEQTRRIFFELAKETTDLADPEEWHSLQRWLTSGEHRVTIPYAKTLAANVPPVAVRMRRDFGALLALIRAHALLHRATRDQDSAGRIVATIEDYAIVRELVSATLSAGVESSVPPAVRQTVSAVAHLAGEDGATALAVGRRLGIDKSNASRRLRTAADTGYVVNLEDRRGKPARWVLGEPMPEDVEILPDPATLSGCAVAREIQGIARPDGQNRDAGEFSEHAADAYLDEVAG